MSEVLRAFNVKLTGETGHLDKALAKSSGGIKGFADKANSSLGGMKGGFAGLAGMATGPMIALAAGAVGAAFSFHSLHKQIEEMSVIKDTSDRLNIGSEALLGFG